MSDTLSVAQERQEAVESFKVFAGRGSHGTIGIKELMHAMRSVGLNPSEAEVSALINEVDTSGRGHVTEEQFVAMMQRRAKDFQVEDEREFKAAFNMFDLDQDGRISTLELRTTIMKFGNDISDVDAEELVRENDVDGDGQLDLFLLLCEYVIKVGLCGDVGCFSSPLFYSSQVMSPKKSDFAYHQCQGYQAPHNRVHQHYGSFFNWQTVKMSSHTAINEKRGLNSLRARIQRRAAGDVTNTLSYPCGKSIAQALTNVFENSDFNFHFDYCENIHDGRGYTAGIVGFTTATHDAFGVITNFTNLVSPNAFTQYYGTLQALNTTGSSSTSGLSGFCDAWSQTAATSVVFREVQVNATDQLYYIPSQALATSIGLTMPLSFGQLYDAAIQHGTENDPDSLPSMAAKTTAYMNSINQPGTPAQGADEKLWMQSFMNVRIQTLQNPSNKATQAAWSQSVTRVKSYQYAANNNQWNFGNVSLKALDNGGSVITVNCDPDLWTRFVPTPSGRSNAGLIIGVVIATLAVVVVAGVGFFWWKRRRNNFTKSPYGSQYGLSDMNRSNSSNAINHAG
ncbi:chitosanase [Synchytrium endobioticum]|uniref:Chitosanase n=1 Tax=Synchytrium endobioticum TaxID=286115 RepID=A0A507D6X3_9FUNG|nr:chitosanase [Synchytrium endobioticum]TPX52390.1 chitosanase [Synchytrium endobioticum]